MTPASTKEAAPPWGRILAFGTTMGVAGDLLLRAPGTPGLNVAVLFFGIAVGIVVVLPASRRRNAETGLLLAIGVGFGGSIALRDSPSLNALSFLVAVAALGLIALRAGRPWLARSGLMDVAEALATTAGHTAAGLVPLAWTRAFRYQSAEVRTRVGLVAGLDRAGVGARGAAIALPFLLVFGGLLSSADPVYAELLQRIVRIDLGPILEHLIPIAVFGWLAIGYFTGIWTGTRLPGLTDRRTPRSILGKGESSIAIGLVDLLFLSFVIVQVRYLFGGAALVEVTPGLTYAEYARAGAFQIGVCAALAIPSLLLADWSVRRSDDASTARRFTTLAVVQVLLLLVVLASAFQRLQVYRDVYGLTLSRLYGTVALAWLGAVAVLFLFTVLRGSRERFAPLGLLSALVAIGILVVSNPESVIVRSNVARLQTDHAPELDATYLSDLSADAVPALLQSIDRLPAEDRCQVALRLLERWGPTAPAEDLRAWDLATSRARRAVADAVSALESHSTGECQEG